MTKDIRLSIGFLDHPKTIKLLRTVGSEGVFALVRLWTYAAQYKTDGVLTGMDLDDIEIACKWNGMQGALLTALLTHKWIDERTDENGAKTYILHDWEEHQGYIVHEKDRVKRAKKAAAKRWGSRDDAKSIADSIADSSQKAMPKHAKSNAPSPTPSPKEKENIKKKKLGDKSSKETPTKNKAPIPTYTVQMFDAFWASYPSRNGKKLEKEETFRRYCLISVEELELVNTAAKNYADSEMIQKGIGVKDPKRFLMDGKGNEYWRQWIEPEEKRNDGTNRRNNKRNLAPGEQDPFEGLGKDC